MTRQRVRVLLVSVGYSFDRDGNFGIPHLVSLGSYVQAHAGAEVGVVDLDYEKHLPDPRPQAILDPRWDVVGLSCYSSYEFLKTWHLGLAIRAHNPGVTLVVGGWHPSARPTDFTGPDSPFDHAVIGEGERPLLDIVAARARSERLPARVLGPDPVPRLDELPPFDWSLLARYLPWSRRIGAQVTMHLSRGCPFRCVFCMEAAKQTRQWRAFSPERAEAELRRLAAAVDLSGRTVYLTDPLFGVNPSWRREMLPRIAALELPVAKWWALSRADVLDDDDLGLFHAAGFGLGFGLESGDPEMLGVIHKGGRPEAYLERFVAMAARAGEIGFPWGANVIVGHPGDTPERLARSARFLARLVDETPTMTGFLSIDPYRYYPGSPIELNLARYEAAYGTKVHRPRWWNDPDQAFTSTWVDGSAALPMRERDRLAAAHLRPVARRLAERYAYDGPASGYFRRAVTSEVRTWQPAFRVPYIGQWYLWRGLTRTGSDDPRRDAEAAALLREARGESVAALEAEQGPLPAPLREALVATPRERFARKEDLWASASDRALPLEGASGPATLSAMHAYAESYRLLGLGAGHRLLELGGGTGYGAALAAAIVGPGGAVRTVELDATLGAAARANLAEHVQVEVITGASAHEVDPHGFDRIVVCFAVATIPPEWVAGLPVGGALVAPVGPPEAQALTRVARTASGLAVTTHGAVRFVPDRAPPPAAS